MKYLSVCSGIEAATTAWHPLGWGPVAFSELDPFPCAVLKHHYPHIPNWGDMTQFGGWPDATVDVLVGGTPCQSFSVAGLRKGLDDPRGNLMLTYGAIAARYRPRWLVWENVPGVLSSNGGRDFGAFLGMLEQLGYGWSYRTLDAQYFGVAQRRRRVFVIGCLGDWRAAAAVLFERASLRGDPAPRREARQGIAGDAVPSIAGSLDTECEGGKLTHQSVANGHLIGTITARMFGALGARDVEEGALLPVYCDPLNQAASDSTAKTLAARSDMDGMGIVAHAQCGLGFDAPVAFNWQNGGGYGNANEGLGITLDASGPLQRCNTPAVAFAQNQRDEVRTMTVAGALAAEPGAKQQTYVAAPAMQVRRLTPRECERLPMDPYLGGEVSIAIDASYAKGCGGTSAAERTVVAQAMTVRRLTPRECERLQGFPDDYTQIPYRNKPAEQCPDGPRYKALGNSMAVPVMRWIGERLAMVEKMRELKRETA